MKIVWSALLIFGLLAGYVPCVYSLDADTGKPPDAKAPPAAQGKAPVKKSAVAFDEATTQSLKKFRSINSALVAAHEELYRLENPDKSTKGVDFRDVLDENKVNREKKEREQSVQTRKATAEDKIKSLQKDSEKLRADLERHYNGTLPKNVEEAWRTEQDYTEYRISKYK